MTESIPQKQCSRCKQIFPATTEFFHSHKSHQDHLASQCKQCNNRSQGEYKAKRKTEPRLIIPDGFRQCNRCSEVLPLTSEYFHRYNSVRFYGACKGCVNKPRDVPEGHKRCTKCKEIKPATTEYFYVRDKVKLSVMCKPCHLDYKKQIVSPGKRLLYSRKREARPHCKAMRERYRHAHIQERSTHARVRRARVQGAHGSHTIKDVRELYDLQQGKCYYCSAMLEQGKGGYHVDHVVPISRGGSNGPENLVIACPTCNMRKGDKLLHEWIDGGRLL